MSITTQRAKAMVRSRGGVVSAEQLEALMDAGLKPSVARPAHQTLDAKSFTDGMRDQILIAWEAKDYSKATYIFYMWLKLCPLPEKPKPEGA